MGYDNKEYLRINRSNVYYFLFTSTIWGKIYSR